MGERRLDRRALSKVFSFTRILYANSNQIGRRTDDNILQMLQPSVCTQLARLKPRLKIHIRNMMNPNYQGPTKVLLNASKIEVKLVSKTNKHWFCGGLRSVSAAANLLLSGKVVALPTDTIYGFAALAQNQDAVEELYKIKKRDENKPLAICVYSITDIHNWGVVDTLPPRFLETQLPGPITIVLKRTPKLNPGLNPGIDNVGIRVPNSKFIRNVVKMVNQPLALTSANESNKPSTLHPREFEELWPQLGGIFYPIPKEYSKNDDNRVGSTVIDLSNNGKFKILRPGISHKSVARALRNCGWVQEDDTQ